MEKTSLFKKYWCKSQTAVGIDHRIPDWDVGPFAACPVVVGLERAEALTPEVLHIGDAAFQDTHPAEERPRKAEPGA